MSLNLPIQLQKTLSALEKAHIEDNAAIESKAYPVLINTLLM